MKSRETRQRNDLACVPIVHDQKNGPAMLSLSFLLPCYTLQESLVFTNVKKSSSSLQNDFNKAVKVIFQFKGPLGCCFC